VQLDLQEEFSYNQVPSNDCSGYFPHDGYYPDSPLAPDYPTEYGIYGTEVFELNIALVEQIRRPRLQPQTKRYESRRGV
jgi:Purine nucleoside permease (NUP)